jgi:hypothetical protein
VGCTAAAEGCVWDGRHSERAGHEAACALARLLARTESERRLFADVLATALVDKHAALLTAQKHACLAHVVERLLAAGAEIDIPTLPGDDTEEEHLAISSEGDDVAFLYRAAGTGNVHVVAALIDHGVDVSGGRGNDNATPLYVAALQGHDEVVELLIDAGADVNATFSHRGITPLYAAADAGYMQVVMLLLDIGNAEVNQACTDDNGLNGCTPLYVATREGHEEVVAQLLVAGADVNQATENGDTPLSIALSLRRIDVVRSLRAAGATALVGPPHAGR